MSWEETAVLITGGNKGLGFEAARRLGEQGWTIFDRETERPASVEGHETVGLPREEADEIADLLNTLSFIERRRSIH